jgi:hypothetical protein
MTDRVALLLRRRRPIGEPDALADGPAAGFALVHGSAGAGRALLSLAALGMPFDNLVQCIHGPDVGVEAIRALDLSAAFPTVILGSHLVNTPDEARRRAWLGVARRHVADGGEVLVEHHPLDWAETAEDEPATPGGPLGMVEVRRDPPFVHAVSVFDIGGHEARQPFTARVLSDAELEAELASAGLTSPRRLSPT